MISVDPDISRGGAKDPNPDSISAAISALKGEKTAKLTVALPVASWDAEQEISRMVDEWVCLQAPPDLRAVGQFYRDFSPVEDEEVMEMLKRPMD